jgi:hypothetical protein
VSESFNWNQFKGNFWTWEFVGQVLEGDLLAVRVGSIDDKEYPELVLRTAAGDVTLSASQQALSRKLSADPPSIGDRVKITYTGEGERSRPHFNPPKLFEVEISHRGAAPAPAAAAPANAPAPVAAPAAPATTDLI